MRKNKSKYILLFAFMSVAIYNLWTTRNINILYVNPYWNGTTVVVVDHTPLTDRAKILWFLDHEEELKRRYKAINYWTGRVVIIDAEGGLLNLKEYPNEDLRCFDDIPSENKCVIKNTVLLVDILAQSLMHFQMGYGGKIYSLDDNGNIQPEIQEWPNMHD
ncbi:DUF943 family protein [Trabulsiella odontotermitis]|uniref:DUF943 family protein n=1 Tax=Trabulsiella odontotermitis TaxID=379893 RepID=UPI0006766582|nr:DUF943 family protein [Trabulsiella odontotermitis]